MKFKFSDKFQEFILIFVLFIMPFLGLVAIPNVYLYMYMNEQSEPKNK